MQFDLTIYKLYHTELYVCVCGTEDCEPGHHFGPTERGFYLIHYILQGKGSFTVKNVTYNLEKGSAFLICPGVTTFYKADHEDPWVYSWIGFNGSKAESYLNHAGLTVDSPVFTDTSGGLVKELFTKMIETKKLHKGKELRLLGLLYMLFSELVEINAQRQYIDNDITGTMRYIKKAIEYIEQNYQKKLSVEQMAKHVNINRSYLGTLFKQNYNISPRDFIINYRMEKAIALLKDTSMRITDIAADVGYDDYVVFSKAFKKHTGISPRHYRKLKKDSRDY